MYKFINWYTKHYKFPKRGWKFFRRFLLRTGLINKYYDKKLHNGTWMRVCPAEHIQQQLFWYGYYEKAAVLTWESLITRTDTVIDIGANAGYYSLVAAPIARQVIAFEPSQKMRQQFEENLRRNGFTNTRIEPYALSDHAGQAELFASAAANTGMTSLMAPENFAGEKETVPVITFDEWATTQKLEAIHLIKIDVEGAEYNVLSGMKTVLAQHKPVLFIEVIGELLAKFGNSVSDVYAFLSKYGYVAYQITGPGSLVAVSTPMEADTILFAPAGFISRSDRTTRRLVKG